MFNSVQESQISGHTFNSTSSHFGLNENQFGDQWIEWTQNVLDITKWEVSHRGSITVSEFKISLQFELQAVFAVSGQLWDKCNKWPPNATR